MHSKNRNDNISINHQKKSQKRETWLIFAAEAFLKDKEEMQKLIVFTLLLLNHFLPFQLLNVLRDNIQLQSDAPIQFGKETKQTKAKDMSFDAYA